MGLPIAVPTTTPAATISPAPRALDFSAGAKRQPPPPSPIAVNVKTILRTSHAARSAIAAETAGQLARSLTERWQEVGAILSAEKKQEREEQLRFEQEQERMKALELARAKAPKVDFFNLFGDEATAVAHGEPRSPVRGSRAHKKSCNRYSNNNNKPEHSASMPMLRSAADDSQSVHSFDSQSLHSLQSMVVNPRAELQMSIKAKSTLMSLVADRASAQYTRLASDQRPGLLQAPKTF